MRVHSSLLYLTPVFSETNTGGTFIAAQSGDFNDVANWVGGTLPSGSCSIIIPFNIVITFNGASLDLNITSFTVRGTFRIISTDNVGFAFVYPTNILVSASGTIKDETDNHMIYVRSDTLFTFLQGGSLMGSNTKISSYSGASPSEGTLFSYTVDSSIEGPFTLAIPLDATVQGYSSIMCVVRQSGSFTDSTSWLGLVAPTNTFCASVGGCDLNVPSGFILSTESLSGALNIQFNEITILAGGSLQLGTSSVTSGFRFTYAVSLNIFGQLKYIATSSNGIFIPYGSAFNFDTNATFVTTILTALRVFDPLTNKTSGSGYILDNDLLGPLYVQVSISGSVSIDTGSKLFYNKRHISLDSIIPLSYDSAN